MRALKAGTHILGGITWLATVYLSFVSLGIGWGLAVLLFPPVTLVFMFIVGTWIPGLIMLTMFTIYSIVGYRKETRHY